MTKTVKFKTTREWLIAQMEAFLQKNPSYTEQSFGWAALRDTSVLERLKKGGDITTRKLDAIIAFMSNPPQR